MRTYITLLLLLTLSVQQSQAQSVLDRFKQKAKDRAEQRLDQGMDKALDKTEEEATKKREASKSTEIKESGKKTPDASSTVESSEESKPAATSFKAYSRYDFVPGENIVYAEDFGQDVIGEFPLKWATNNRGETVTIEALAGKWMQLFKEGHFVSPYIKNLPENFTMEFDLVLNLPPNVHNTNYADIVFRLMEVEPGDEKARKFFNENFDAKADVKIILTPYPEEGSRMSIFSTQGGNNQVYFSKEGKELKDMRTYLRKPIHFAIWIQKERFRLWMNGEKIYDIPQALPENVRFNRISFQTESSPYSDEELGYYVSNIKLAQGAPDMRSKLLTEGRLVTNGILFDVNSDRIKAESAGVLNEIAKVLRENASVKVKIVGHTDSDGEESKNLDLSRRRAAAVREALAKEYGIDATRMQWDGMGETKPVADNVTKEGKAQNRRVEFIKQ
jgi:outer membrane protein OmpA-like peptidoglycan-associated protein